MYIAPPTFPIAHESVSAVEPRLFSWGIFLLHPKLGVGQIQSHRMATDWFQDLKMVTIIFVLGSVICELFGGHWHDRGGRLRGIAGTRSMSKGDRKAGRLYHTETKGQI